VIVATTKRLPEGPSPFVAMTIAGSDSGGGAGIAADLETFAAHGVFGTLALTAVTAQDTKAVHDVLVVPVELVEAQITCVASDFVVRAVKTGMLATVAIVDCLASFAQAGQLPRLVVDPVMVSSTGALLLEGDAIGAYRRLLSYAQVATPNLPETEALLGRSVETKKDMIEAARALFDFGVAFAVIKGGHLGGKDALDIVFDGREVLELHEDKVQTRNTHGTGCTFSAAIAANLALGLGPLDAIVAAKLYVTDAIHASSRWNLGAGIGPINHFVRRFDEGHASSRERD
jgi:hydroxymethylpyrimidine kinase/phosphomethylpyrimidine kinase